MLPLFELTCHWYVFPLPVAENVKEVLAPNEIVLLIGWLVTTGELFVFNITILELNRSSNCSSLLDNRTKICGMLTCYLAHALCFNGQYDEALKELNTKNNKEYVCFRPVRYFEMLAINYAGLGRFEEAIYHYTQAINLGNRRLLLERALCSYELEQCDSALNDCVKFLASFPSTDREIGKAWFIKGMLLKFNNRLF